VPELPDVEGFRRTFIRHAAGKTVQALMVDTNAARNTTAQGLGRALKHRTFADPTRRGKWLICPTEGPSMVLHFGMTGTLLWMEGRAERHPHDRLILVLTDGQLVFRDMRKLGGVWLARRERDLNALLERVGPDALAATSTEFLARLRGRRSSVKSALLNQKVVAGLGNLTVDESLWRAGIAPRRAVSSLSDEDLALLQRETHKVLHSSAQAGRVPDRGGWLTAVRGRGASCPRCGASLLRDTVAGRTTYWCPRCQAE
jgi:formamidopyrimidine-DNA glycosylase